jgi:hypothetical protein
LRRLRLPFAILVLGTAVMAQHAVAASAADTTTTTGSTPTTTTTTSTTPTPPPTTTTTTTTTTATPATGITVTPAPTPKPPKHGPGAKHPQSGAQGPGGGKQAGGKQGAKEGKQGKAKHAKSKKGKTRNGAAVAPGVAGLGNLSVGAFPSGPCGVVSAPTGLMPIYQQASDAYGLGPQGPGVLAAINGIESGFGANLGPSSAGAIGWMQFLPSTWSIYGVDANGDGVADPNDPTDAIFAAARYLSAAGMPADTPGAIFAYNHADWYVGEVLSNAACYSGTAGALSPIGVQTLTCNPAHDTHVPEPYMAAFEAAATRYDLGQRGVWALTAIARLESNFGRSMTPGQLVSTGPLGLDRDEWNRFEVDGDGDGHIEPADIYDSAATLAREFWSRGDLRSGIFLHNQAEWYVQQVLAQADQVAGRCTSTPGAAPWTVSLPQTSLTATSLAGVALGPGGALAWSTKIYDGVPVCTYIVPILDAARSLGWNGQVLSGYRTFAEQSAIHASGVYSAQPGLSNHEGCAGGTTGPANGAVDVSDYQAFDTAMAKLGYPLRNTLGPVDPGHFSPGGN